MERDERGEFDKYWKQVCWLKKKGTIPFLFDTHEYRQPPNAVGRMLKDRMNDL